jgi:2'-5' RNA ligase
MTFPWSDGSDIALVPASYEGTWAQYEADEVVSAPQPEEIGLSAEDALRVLGGDLTPLGLTAAVGYDASGDEHTGAMIALLPSEEDMNRLAVPGGEEDEELHLTLVYLGEAAKITPFERDNIVRWAQSAAANMPIIEADGFGVGAFNQDKDQEPCVVLLVSGEELARAHRVFNGIAHDAMAEGGVPDQYTPWVPHVTLAYTDNASMVKKLRDREGDIRFDHVRVTFGSEVTDIPLYDGTASSNAAQPEVAMAADGTGSVGGGNTFGVDTTLAGGKESDVNKKGGSHNLKNHWVHGPGAAEIEWGTDGAFARCVAKLGKYVKNPQGLCAEYHKAATGEWPAEKGVESAVDIAVTADAAVDIEAELGEYDGGWTGPIAAEDSDTGDGRMFSGGALTWGDTAETIHPFQWAPSNLGEHKGSVTAGRIDKMWRHPENPRLIMGQGRFNVNDPDGLRAFRQVRDGFAGGVSIDPDQIADADVELEFAMDSDASDPFAKPTKTIFHAGRIRGATLVAFPALVEAAIKLTKKGSTDGVVASVTDAPWEGLQHELRLGDGDLDGLVAAGAFAYVHDIDDVVSRQQCRFLHHEIGDDGQPGRASLVACARHINAINAGRSFGLTTSQLQDAYDHMAQHFKDAGRIPPALSLKVEAVTASIPVAAPLEWFGNPSLSGPTPVTVTDDGRVFGHAATWGTCHTGFADTCVTPPMENDYSYFTTGEVLTAEGHSVAVGQITLGTSHAATRGLSVAKAIDHYGDTGTAVADVTCGTDEHGIWVAGAVRPGASADHLHALRASALSGDWRRIGGQLRMVALLAVNVPGFPIPRTGTALAAGKQVSLVAAGVVDRSMMTFEDEVATLAHSCGIPGVGKPKEKKYTSMAEELVALDADVFESMNIKDRHGHVHGKDGKFIGTGGGGGIGDFDPSVDAINPNKRENAGDAQRWRTLMRKDELSADEKKELRQLHKKFYGNEDFEDFEEE